MITGCNLCEDASNFHIGLRGKNYDQTKILFAMHKPDSRVENLYLPIGDPYVFVLSKTATGRNLAKILKACELTWEDIYLTNVFKCTLPRDRDPTRREYSTCQAIFNSQLDEIKPRLMIVSGNKPYWVLFPEEKVGHREMIGKVLYYRRVPALVLPHLSSMQVEKIGRERYNKAVEKLKAFIKS